MGDLGDSHELAVLASVLGPVLSLGKPSGYTHTVCLPQSNSAGTVGLSTHMGNPTTTPRAQRALVLGALKGEKPRPCGTKQLSLSINPVSALKHRLRAAVVPLDKTHNLRALRRKTWNNLGYWGFTGQRWNLGKKQTKGIPVV